jgi:hypothetical protein
MPRPFSSGNWSFSSFTCTNQSDELYLVATGGNPGLATGTNNSALILTTVAGPCNNLFSTVFNINEITTVATEYALAGFSTTYQNLGSSTTNSIGLTNAFKTVTNLVNLSTGAALISTPAYSAPPANTTPDVYHGIVPYDTINTLADVIATCVNTTSGSSSACQSLFSITGGSLALPIGQHGVVGPTASNTADAALYIAHNPGLPAASNYNNTNLANLYALVTSSAPFTPYLGAAPTTDYALTLNFIGGGLGGVKTTSTVGAQSLKIDQQGNIWIPNGRHPGIIELSNLGVPLSPNTYVNTTTGAPILPLGGFTGGGSTEPRYVAIDQSGNAWVSDGANCLTEFSPAGAALSPSTGFTGPCAGAPSPAYGVSVDGANQVWIAGQNPPFISAANSSTGAIATGNFPITTGFDVLTGWTGPDQAGHTWYIDEGNGSFGEFTETGTLVQNSGTLLSGTDYYAAFGPDTGEQGTGLAVWSVESDIDSIQPFDVTGSNDTTFLPGQYLINTITGPGADAMDGNARVYITNNGDLSEGVPPNVTVLLSNGTQVSSEATGYAGGSVLTALDIPTDLAVDQSGNVWVLNTNDANSTGSGTPGYIGNGTNSSNVTEFVGLAAPVNPVFSLDAKNGTYATLP